MLLIVEKRIMGGIGPAIHRYAKVNNKYMKKIQQRQGIIIYRVVGCK